MKLKLFKLLFTNEIASDRPYLRKIVVILLIGLVIRLIFMPISAHNDFLSEHIRAEYIIFGGNPFAVTSQFLPHYIDAAFLFIFAPFIPDHGEIFKLPSQAGSASTVENEPFIRFIDSPNSYRALFLLKLPYLIGDFLCFFMLLRLIKDKKHAPWLAGFWMFNPISLYAIYIYGRFEIYGALFLIASLLFCKKERPYLSSLMLGFAIASRSYLLMLLPLFPLLISKKWGARITSFALAVVPTVAYSLFANLLGSGPFFYKALPASNVIESLAEGGFIGLGLLPRLEIGQYHIYLFIFALTLIYIWTLHKKEYGFFSVVRGSSLIIFTYFLLAPFSTHWFFWTVPWLALFMAESKESRWAAWAIPAVWFLHSAIYSDWSVFTLYLFSPINPQYFMASPSLSQVISSLTQNMGLGAKSILSQETLLGVARSILSGMIFYIILRLIKRNRQQVE
ncbi:MAG: hypothetical protein M1371_08910 [Actinobacteria bacterium]|nr:hypothetical protein [Actinomycetota bacterium]